MFIGHYAVALAAKRIDQRPSLGILFMAAQWLDLLWPVLLLTGVEKFEIDPGNTVITPLNFQYYPWSHSLVMALVWSLAFGMVYNFVSRNRQGSFMIAFLVFSHWLLDWITHRPDLPISPFSDLKVGLGLWNYKWIEIFLEALLFISGVYLYLKTTRPRNKTGKWSFWSLVVLLVVVHYANVFGPPPPSREIVSWSALSLWILVAWGFWIDRNRE